MVTIGVIETSIDEAALCPIRADHVECVAQVAYVPAGDHLTVALVDAAD